MSKVIATLAAVATLSVAPATCGAAPDSPRDKDAKADTTARTSRPAHPVPSAASARPGPSTPSARPTPARKPQPARRGPAVTPIRANQPVAVVNLGPTDPATVKSIASLYTALASGRLGKPLADESLRAALAGVSFDPSTAEAYELLRRGRLAFASLNRTGAVELLDRAESLFLKHVPLSQAKKGLALTWTYLLLSLHDLGLRARARAAARALASLAGGKRPEGIPPATWKQNSPARARRAQRKLTVTAPAGAAVYVDFVQVPATVKKGVPPVMAQYAVRVDTNGHHVTVEATGRRHFYSWVAPGRSLVNLKAFLAPAPTDAHRTLRASLKRIRALGAESQPAALASLMKPYGTVRIIAAGPAHAHLTVRLLDVGTARYVGPSARLSLPIKPDNLTAFERWTATVADVVAKEVALAAAKIPPKGIKPGEAARKAAKEVTGKKEPLSKDKKKKPKPLWKQWYFWVAAAAVATVITVFALRKDEGNTVEVRVYKR